MRDLGSNEEVPFSSLSCNTRRIVDGTGKALFPDAANGHAWSCCDPPKKTGTGRVFGCVPVVPSPGCPAHVHVLRDGQMPFRRQSRPRGENSLDRPSIFPAHRPIDHAVFHGAWGDPRNLLNRRGCWPPRSGSRSES